MIRNNIHVAWKLHQLSVRVKNEVFRGLVPADKFYEIAPRRSFVFSEAVLEFIEMAVEDAIERHKEATSE